EGNYEKSYKFGNDLAESIHFWVGRFRRKGKRPDQGIVQRLERDIGCTRQRYPWQCLEWIKVRHRDSRCEEGRNWHWRQLWTRCYDMPRRRGLQRAMERADDDGD